MEKEKMYWPSDIILPIVENKEGKNIITLKIRQHRLDRNWKELHELIDDLIHEGKLKKWVLLNYREIDDDETKPTMFIDAVKNDPDVLSEYIKTKILKQDLRIAHQFYFDAMDIANDLNNMHGGKTKKIEKLEKLFHNTYR